MADTDPFAPPNPGADRARRDHAALFRIAERHAGTDERRRRHAHADVPEPYEAASLVLALAAGGAEVTPDEEPVDRSDLIAALTLLPRVRADVDTLEAGLLALARDRGLTWQEIAFGLGLGSAQAARQRFDRVTGRTTTTG
ncbi:DNA-binding protein [Micromonospora cathayae]|uniref:DNA-binding protein n=1 Tax=Micromonospora cathayae TaxID=3028804 RepID=A0ABY7ZHM4_9ACTN|nr:DNA-binding protein [Micromonospora sp. HUAS 3]WDZ82380.1 DNA-binding protein [Micromonospora sp. HUAS 3]